MSSSVLGIEKAIHRASLYLASQQQVDGSFISYSSPAFSPFEASIPRGTNFVPALILTALSNVNTPLVRQIRDRLAHFLLSQRSLAGSYNYWVKDAPERKTMPYPDDLDDTFCVLLGLFLHDPSIVDNAVLAQTVKLLVATETTTGGPYRTWLVPPSSPSVWQDVDLAVNSNIAYFLSLVSNPLPALEDYMGRAIETKKLTSPYYPSARPLLYYLSRACGTSQRIRLTKLAQTELARSATALDHALCLRALLQLSHTRDLELPLKMLVAQQLPDGSWPAAAFCIDPAQNGAPFYHGAPVLTTGFVIETLQSYLLHAENVTTKLTKQRSVTARVVSFQTAVATTAKSQCSNLGSELRQDMLRTLQHITHSDNGPEIMVLPYYFNHSLLRPLPASRTALLRTLGVANLFGWLAYTIYDDFIDEAGKPPLLPVANVAMRRSLHQFLQALPGSPNFAEAVRQTFDTVDSANAWELAHCRFPCENQQLVIQTKLPDYGDLAQLAERSLGHSLSPLAILMEQGSSTDSAAFAQTQKALKHYLIARQLNDDAHDWQTDVQNGHISYVVGLILEQLDYTSGSYPLEELLVAMRQQFWYHTLPNICQEMKEQIMLSRRAIQRSSVLKPADILSQLLDGIEASVEATLTTQTQARSFLEHYQNGDTLP